MYYDIVSSPLGKILITEKDEKLSSLKFLNQHESKDQINELLSGMRLKRTPLLVEAQKQLNEYFKSQREKFDIALAPRGTEFQLKAWQILAEIPYGNTISYSEQARFIGSERYRRAVAQANGRNPIPVIIPCHRVINKNGRLGGFSSGLENKAWLLNLERKIS